MRPSPLSVQCVLVLATLSVAWAASSWSFDDATLSIQSKKAGVGGAHKEKYGRADQLTNSVAMLKISS